MTSSATVVDAFVTMRDALEKLAERSNDRVRRAVLSQRADVAGELAEQCQQRFDGGDVPDGAHAVQDANHATTVCKAADPAKPRDLDRAADAAGRANTTLNGILQTGHQSSPFAGHLEIALDDVIAGDAKRLGAEDTPEKNASPGTTIALVLAAAVVTIVLPMVLFSRSVRLKRRRAHDRKKR